MNQPPCTPIGGTDDLELITRRPIKSSARRADVPLGGQAALGANTRRDRVVSHQRSSWTSGFRERIGDKPGRRQSRQLSGVKQTPQPDRVAAAYVRSGASRHRQLPAALQRSILITSSALASKDGGTGEAKRLGGGQVEHKLQFGGPLYRQIRRHCALQNLPGIDTDLTESICMLAP